MKYVGMALIKMNETYTNETCKTILGEIKEVLHEWRFMQSVFIHQKT
jgi:hypothetical protein